MRKAISIINVLCLVLLIIVGCNKSDVSDVQRLAEEFITELYTVNSEEIAILDLKTKDIKLLAETNESNDKIFESLMTKRAYNIFVKSRQSFMYTLYCAKSNHTMEVLNITLSQNPNDTVDKVDYDFDVKVKFISNNENTEQTDTAKGYLRLIKENGEWKVSDYREIELLKTIAN